MGEYRIRKLSDHDPKPGTPYFLDANVWIYVLDPSTSPEFKVYVDFFYKLITAIDTYDIQKEQSLKDGKVVPDSSRPEIVLTPMLLSEMFNVLIRERFKAWRKSLAFGDPRKEELSIKVHFRGEQEHEDAVKHFRTELFQFEKYFVIVDDSDEVIGIKELCFAWDYNMDFNDQCFYLTCQTKKYNLVTNDGDYSVEYVDIYTERPSLLALSTV